MNFRKEDITKNYPVYAKLTFHIESVHDMCRYFYLIGYSVKTHKPRPKPMMMLIVNVYLFIFKV